MSSSVTSYYFLDWFRLYGGESSPGGGHNKGIYISYHFLKLYRYRYLFTAVLWLLSSKYCTLNLDPDPEFWPNLGPDSGYLINFERKILK